MKAPTMTLRVLVLALMLAMTVVACGASAREKTISATFATTNVLRDGFSKWDLEHQQALLANAIKVKEDPKVSITEYRTKRAPVLQGFEDLYRAIATALIVANDPKSLPNMLAAGIAAKNLVDDFKKIEKIVKRGDALHLLVQVE